MNYRLFFTVCASVALLSVAAVPSVFAAADTAVTDLQLLQRANGCGEAVDVKFRGLMKSLASEPARYEETATQFQQCQALYSQLSPDSPYMSVGRLNYEADGKEAVAAYLSARYLRTRNATDYAQIASALDEAGDLLTQANVALSQIPA